MASRVVLVGLDPRVVDYSDPAYAAFPGLHEDVLRAALDKDRQTLIDLGYDAIWSFWDKSDAADSNFEGVLRSHKPQCVMIGAGVRFNPKLTTLFERLVALVRRNAPDAALCFNSGPHDSAEAVERVLQYERSTSA